MTDWNPRCYNCIYASPAAQDKEAEERKAAEDFVLCGKSKTYMYKFDYCTQHPDILKKIAELKEAKR